METQHHRLLFLRSNTDLPKLRGSNDAAHTEGTPRFQKIEAGCGSLGYRVEQTQFGGGRVQRLSGRTISPVIRRLARFDASSCCRTAGKLFHVLCNALNFQAHTVATHNDGVIGVRLKR